MPPIETDAERVKILENQVVGFVSELTEMRRERDKLRAERDLLMAAFVSPVVVTEPDDDADDLEEFEPYATGQWLAAGNYAERGGITEWDAVDSRAEAEAIALRTVTREVGVDPWGTGFYAEAAKIEAERGPLPVPSGDVR